VAAATTTTIPIQKYSTRYRYGALQLLVNLIWSTCSMCIQSKSNKAKAKGTTTQPKKNKKKKNTPPKPFSVLIS